MQCSFADRHNLSIDMIEHALSSMHGAIMQAASCGKCLLCCTVTAYSHADVQHY